jgi:hypothetical protein
MRRRRRRGHKGPRKMPEGRKLSHALP